MKTRETKQNDLNALTESLAASKSAMVVTFSGVTVAKDQEFRNSLREAGAQYQVVKNTLARIAVKGTQFEQATEAGFVNSDYEFWVGAFAPAATPRVIVDRSATHKAKAAQAPATPTAA